MFHEKGDEGLCEIEVPFDVKFAFPLVAFPLVAAPLLAPYKSFPFSSIGTPHTLTV